MTRLGLGIVAALLLIIPADAHHSPAAFNLNSQIAIQGKIARVDWTNPHVYLYVTVSSGLNGTVEWIIETDPTPILTRSGWSREALRVGSDVTVRASPDRNTQRNHAFLISLALSDDTVLVPRAPANRTVARANGLAGVWNALRGFGLPRSGTFKPTAKALAALKTYSEMNNPIGKCVPFATPSLTRLPYLNQIEVRKDQVTIRTEFFNVDRVVYIDGRGHSKNAARTTQGHSIGRWEGEVLVVDTTQFADHAVGNATAAPGLPSGSQKHVTERFRLSDDRTRLIIDFLVEDPEYLAEPYAFTTEWDYAPEQRLLRFKCDPEQARRFTFQ